mmetsp:Transcript_13628/g.24033  ORF Transcript_13628/g.24033 Transcript_13628/m.24033 type:complete len:394 (-) Transcript_13628:120-1301(-)
MAVALQDAFYAFTADSSGMDGRAFVKCLKDAGLLDQRLKTADADIIFAKCKVKAARKINFETFVKALQEVAQKRQLRKDTVVDFICLAHGPSYESKSFSATEAAGPERFFYDKSTYTGTHKCGGPDGGSLVVTDKGLVNRDRQHEIAASAERRERATSDIPVLLGRRSMSQAEKSPRETPREKSKEATSPCLTPGPERFYYDRSTYTGTWRHGGPTAKGSAVAKDGYSDLSVLVRRDVVQDDVLQRRQRRNAVVGEARSAQASPQQSPSNRSGSLPTLLGSRSAPVPPREVWEKAKPVKPAVLAADNTASQQDTKHGMRVPDAPRLGTRYIRAVQASESADPPAVAVAAFSPHWSPKGCCSAPAPIYFASAGKVSLPIARSGQMHVVTTVPGC